MSNLPSWLSKWTRSPRQDRRVIEDGKFVEQGKVQLSEPPPVEEQAEVNTALEVVLSVSTSEGQSVSEVSQAGRDLLVGNRTGRAQ